MAGYGESMQWSGGRGAVWRGAVWRSRRGLVRCGEVRPGGQEFEFFDSGCIRISYVTGGDIKPPHKESK